MATAATSPLPAAVEVFSDALLTPVLSAAEKPRSIPVRTSLTDHKRSAIAPAKFTIIPIIALLSACISC
jgi:hypothetical protein